MLATGTFVKYRPHDFATIAEYVAGRPLVTLRGDSTGYYDIFDWVYRYAQAAPDSLVQSVHVADSDVARLAEDLLELLQPPQPQRVVVFNEDPHAVFDAMIQDPSWSVASFADSIRVDNMIPYIPKTIPKVVYDVASGVAVRGCLLKEKAL